MKKKQLLPKEDFLTEEEIVFLKSFKEFSKAYYELKNKIQETQNPFCDGLEIKRSVEPIIEKRELEPFLYVFINEFYALVYEKGIVAYIQCVGNSRY